MKTKRCFLMLLCSMAILATTVWAQTDVQFTTLWQQSQSGHARAKNYVVRSMAEWQTMTRQMQAAALLPRSASTDSLMRKLDFNKQMIIAVFQGEKPSGGYSIAITKLVQRNNRLEVEIAESSPGANCFTTQALTQPYHVIVTAKSALKVVFNTHARVVDCK